MAPAPAHRMYCWLPTRTRYGHLSILSADGITYVSFWPQKNTKKVIFGTPPHKVKSLAEDCAAEKSEPDYFLLIPEPLLDSILLRRDWDLSPPVCYCFLRSNCADAVLNVVRNTLTAHDWKEYLRATNAVTTPLDIFNLTRTIVFMYHSCSTAPRPLVCQEAGIRATAPQLPECSTKDLLVIFVNSFVRQVESKLASYEKSLSWKLGKKNRGPNPLLYFQVDSMRSTRLIHEGYLQTSNSEISHQDAEIRRQLWDTTLEKILAKKPLTTAKFFRYQLVKMAVQHFLTHENTFSRISLGGSNYSALVSLGSNLALLFVKHVLAGNVDSSNLSNVVAWAKINRLKEALTSFQFDGCLFNRNIGQQTEPTFASGEKHTMQYSVSLQDLHVDATPVFWLVEEEDGGGRSKVFRSKISLTGATAIDGDLKNFKQLRKGGRGGMTTPQNIWRRPFKSEWDIFNQIYTTTGGGSSTSGDKFEYFLELSHELTVTHSMLFLKKIDEQLETTLVAACLNQLCCNKWVSPIEFQKLVKLDKELHALTDASIRRYIKKSSPS